MPPEKIVRYIEEWTGEALTPEERERIRELHPICKLKVLYDLVKRGVREKDRVLAEITTRCAGKLHGIAKLSAELERAVRGT